MRYALGVVIVMSVVAGRAHAQSNAVAEQLFNDARALAAQGKWQEACPKFEASLQRDPALGTRLNLATCYEKVGKLASAWGMFRESADIAKKANDTKRADYAQQQAAALEPRLPKLVINAPAKPPAGLIVQRDGAAVAPAELGIGLYVDPGAHEVTATAPGFEPVSSKIMAQEGKTETVALPDLKPKPDVKPPPGGGGDEDNPTTPVSPTRKYIGLGVGGGGIVIVGLGLVFGAQAISKNNKAKELCGDNLTCSGSNFSEAQQLISDGRSKGTLSTVFVITGVAAVGAGVFVYLTAPRATERSHATAARIVPVIDRDGAGFGVAGSF
jgi:tetratricopeptide (TPR) repeat protein